MSSKLKNLIQMTAGGQMPTNMPTQQAVMPQTIANAAPPTTFQAGTPQQAAPQQAPVAQAPVQQQQQAAPQHLRQVMPPTGPAMGITVADGGQPMFAAPVQAPAPVVQAPVNTDPLHAQIFGTPVAQAPAVQQFAPTQQQVQQPKPPLPSIESLFQPQQQPMNSGPLIQVPPIEEDEFDPDFDGDVQVSEEIDEYEGVAEGEIVNSPAVLPTLQAVAAALPPVAPSFAPVNEVEDPGEDQEDEVQEAEVAPAAPAVNKIQFPAYTVNKVDNGNMAEDDELSIAEELVASVEQDMAAASFAMGITLLGDSNAYDKNNLAHEAIWYARWNREGLMKLDVEKILEFGVALSIHQVWVAGEENKWKARYEGLGVEMSDLVRKKRRHESGKTEGEKEDAVFKKQPAMRELRRRFVQSKAMSTMLGGMADRFAQLENSLKRPADKKAAEQNRNDNGRTWAR